MPPTAFKTLRVHRIATKSCKTTRNCVKPMPKMGSSKHVFVLGVGVGVLAVLHRLLRVPHRVLGVPHRVLGVPHRVLGVPHRVLG